MSDRAKAEAIECDMPASCHGRPCDCIASDEFGNEKALEGCIDGNCESEQVRRWRDICGVHGSPR